MDQDKLFRDSYRPPKHYDFRGLPHNVYPTTIDILGQGGDFLHYRDADRVRGISRRQNQLFHHYQKATAVPECDTRITTIVVTGLPQVTDRTMTIYDGMDPPPEQPKTKLVDDDEINAFIVNWFNARIGQR